MPAQGTLVVRTHTSDAWIPVAGATVAVTQINPQGEETLLGLRQTDESGYTAPLIVQTPDPAQSQYPGSPVPFASVNILCDHPGYEQVRIENAQVFPNTISIQNIVLLPLQAFPDQSSQTEEFDIPPQNL